MEKGRLKLGFIITSFVLIFIVIIAVSIHSATHKHHDDNPGIIPYPGGGGGIPIPGAPPIWGPVPVGPTPIGPTPVGPTPTPELPAPVGPTPTPELPAPVGPTPTPELPAPVGPTPTPELPAPVGPTPTPELPAPVGPTPTPEVPAPVGPTPTPTIPTPVGPTPTPVGPAPGDRPTFDITSFGARPDGQTDSAAALLAAWGAACSSGIPATVTIPQGNFVVSQISFIGGCNNTDVRIVSQGTLLAPENINSGDVDWILFKNVAGVSVLGGTIDGQGQKLWSCKRSGGDCSYNAASFRVRESKDFNIGGLTSLNSKMFHIAISESNNVKIDGVMVEAPGDSPNTDGIHIQMSSSVTVVNSNIKTGDDCISMGAGATDIWIEGINCGPGHGISIGSLGKDSDDAGVQNITVQNVMISGTQNGVRIKTWGKPYSGFVRNVIFQDIMMNNAENPIIINQNYCANSKCGDQDSRVQISDIHYINIHGTSATEVAVKFDCSASNPCRGITLQDIDLTYEDKQAESFCSNVHGTATGVINPPTNIES